MILVIVYGFLPSGELVVGEIVFICTYPVKFEITHYGVS